MNDWQVSMVVINTLLIGGFAFTAYSTFKEFNPWSCVSMLISLVCLYVINQ